MIENLTTIAIPVITAIVFSVLQFVKKNVNLENPQAFEPAKFGAYVALGILLGVASIFSGIQVTQTNIEAMFLTYGGALVLIETILKSFYRYYVAGAST